MNQAESYLKGKRILAVDDEQDITDTIKDLLETAEVETAADYQTASEKIATNSYDLVILDIMGVNGLKLLEEAVERQIPAVMLTAHAINPETLMESIRKGAISYLPKETLAEIGEMISEILMAHERGKPPWKIVFDRLGEYFDERFGPGWKDREKAFWKDFTRTYQVGRGIQERLKKMDSVKAKGI